MPIDAEAERARHLKKLKAKRQNEPWYFQPYFHGAHHLRPPWAHGVMYDRGAIVEIKEDIYGNDDKNDRHPITLQFLHNPAALEVQYQVNERVLGGDAQTPNAAAVTPLFPAPITFGLELHFNRTFEVADTDDRWTNHEGVLLDIHTLERLMGIPVRTTSGRQYRSAHLQGASTIQGLSYRPLLFRFNNRPGHRSMKFRGYIMGASVRYAMFAHDMVPTWAVVNLTVTQQMIPPRPDRNTAGTQDDPGQNPAVGNRDDGGSRDSGDGRRTTRVVPIGGGGPDVPRPGLPDGGVDQSDPENLSEHVPGGGNNGDWSSGNPKVYNPETGTWVPLPPGTDWEG